MHRYLKRAGLVVAAAMVPAALLAAPSVSADDGSATAVLVNAGGAEVGRAKFIQQGSKVLVKVEASSLTPGYHGFHVHGTGVCTAPSFASAGGHFNPGGGTHRDHAGDMPVLLAGADGAAEARFKIDRFTVAEILGRAVIVHDAPDNYANIPGRYHSHSATFNPADGFGPDADTLAKGDAGGRFACGVIQPTE